MKVGALETDKPFLCELGWHKPRPVARWNCGYYFTTCARCGEDLVRTAYGHWHVPHGYRVVWQPEPPANAVSAALVRDRAAAGPAGGTELPIEEVLRHIQNGPPPIDARPADPGVEGETPADARPDALGTGRTEDDSEPPQEAMPTARERSMATAPARRIPDFMDEATEASPWESPSRVYLRRRAPAGPVRGDFAEEDRGPGPFRRLSARLVSLAGREGARGTSAEPAHGPDAPGGVAPGWRLALLLAIPIIAVLLVLVLKDAGQDGPAAGANESMARGAPVGPDAGQPAFVTASVLNCRSAPAREAESVRMLERGEAVRLLARDGEWVSLAYEGGQCWALLRYFSLDEPV
jgi:hypothetical protein